MTVLRVTFLGTSAAAPTVRRGLSATMIRFHSDRILVDCGEGTQRQMLRYGTGLAVDRVLFTHFHADHYLGVVGYLRTLSMHDRSDPVELLGPAPGVHELLQTAVHLGFRETSFPLRYGEVTGGDVIDRGDFLVRAVAVEHRTPALAWVFEEPPRPGRMDLERARRLGVPVGPLLGRLQRGEAVTTPAGDRVEPGQVLGPPRPGRKLVLSGDTRPCGTLIEAARGADLLIHEATFSESEKDRALETTHSTALEAGQVAAAAQAKRLVLTHLSSRYDHRPGVLRREARQAFDGPVEVAEDGMEIELPLVDG